jgi:glycosyltransferase involved in cell wall biosynthesis
MSSRALGMARALVQCNHEVALFMPPWQTPQEADRWWEEGGVTMRYTPLGTQPPATSRNLLKDVLSWRPDAVHGFKPKAYSGLAMWWLWQFHRQNFRLVVDMDDWEGPGGWNDLAPYTAVQKRFFTWQEQWGMNHAHALTVASRTLESIVWSNGIPPERVLYLPNGSGLDLAGMPLPTKQIQEQRDKLGLGSRPALLVYSRFFEFDAERLATVLAGANKYVPDLAILFIGESLYHRDAQRIRTLLEQNGVLPAVIDLGWVEEAELPLLLRASDVALYLMDDTLVNRCKCPVKLADLIAAGVAVVAEDVGQVSDYVINGATGLLRLSGDLPGLVSDVVTLLLNPDKRSALGQAARKHYSNHFSWERLAGKLDAVYGWPADP